MAKDIAEYAKAQADLKRINAYIMPIMNAMNASARVFEVARKAAADIEMWSREAAEIDGRCTELAAKEAAFRKQKDEAEALVAPAQRESERAITVAAHEARDQLVSIAKSVEDAKKEADAEKRRFSREMSQVVKEMAAKKSDLEVAHTSRMAEMAVEAADAQKKLDELYAAIEDLKKKF